MNIQIFGRKKSFDTDKAKRFFKERNIPFQYIDLDEKGFSKGELTKVAGAVGGLDQLIDPKTKVQDVYHLVQHMRDENRFNKVLENPKLIVAPVVRDGGKATVGYVPDVWLQWINDA
ncbi:MAG TPA: ArsC family transcriptional regulator [Fastidiosipila sp.]|jgi:arsenate reductase|nr:ArsC family transcriptional regulator [Fastidiosipila sp.]